MIPPSTPPRLAASSSSSSNSSANFTPRTPKHHTVLFNTPKTANNKKQGLFVTPRKQNQPTQGQKLFASSLTAHVPVTPEITPARSQTRKKRVHVDDIISDNPVNKMARAPANDPSVVVSLSGASAAHLDEFSFGLFLPVPSTVGSGRKTASLSAATTFGSSLNSSFLKPPPALDFEIAHEEDPEEDENPARFLSNHNISLMYPSDDVEPLSSPTKLSAPTFTPQTPSRSSKKSRRRSLTPQMGSDIFGMPPASSHSKVQVPQTPRGQLLDDDMVHNLQAENLKSRFNFEDDVESFESIDMEVDMTPYNPFALPSKSSKSKSIFNPTTSSSATRSSSKVDYSTHMETVNNRTGERKVVELLQEQQAIKPRKLDFGSFK